jgi:carbon-monoxide dehydrogenase medium subunit
MIPFDLQEPHALPEALQLLNQDDPGVRPFGGGTALMLMMKAGVFRPTRLVSLRKLAPQYSAIELADGALRVGALATLAALERSAAVRRELPVVARALRTLSNVRVRNVATLGGHLAHADPHMDLPPVLIALGAQLTAVSATGARTLAAEDLFKGYYETVLGGAELITEVRIPVQGERGAAYLKCTTRSADDWPALGVAAVIAVDGDTVHEARVVVSAATEKPTRLRSVEALLQGRRVDGAVLEQVGEAAAAEANVVSGTRGSAAYRRALLRVYVARAVQQAMRADARRSA